VRKFAHQAPSVTPKDAEPEDAPSRGELLPSKTRRKAEMHALQDLGEAMVRLTPARLAALALPERLADAIAEARQITRWEARRRQMQFIGRLMRDVDPLPIQARLEQWEGAPTAEKARLAHVERWRTRLLSEDDALDRLCVEHPSADRPRLEALVTRVRDERAHGQPPHAYRELFRTLNALLAAT
jgi:ribosome-associated protein